MIFLRFLVLFSLLHLAILVPAQNFKVIKETDDYILKECDSAYYYSHGLPPKDDFVLDTTKIHKVNGVLKLPLDNGKEVVFRDDSSKAVEPIRTNNYEGINRKSNLYIIKCDFHNEEVYYLLINKKNGAFDTLWDKPIFSPIENYYAYPFNGDMIWDMYVCYKNINNNKVDSVDFQSHRTILAKLNPIEIKWIDDHSFLFKAIPFTYTDPIGQRIQYYLVEIKK